MASGNDPIDVIQRIPILTKVKPINNYTKEGERFSLNKLILISNIESRATNNKAVLNDLGKNLYSSLYFLTKFDDFATALHLLKILKLRGHDRMQFSLKMYHFKVIVDTVDLDMFQNITIMAINYLPPSVKDVKGGTSIMLNIFHHLFDFMKVKNPYVVSFTRTAYTLMRNLQTDLDMQASERLVLSVANTFMTLSPHAKAIDYVDKMSNLVVKRWADGRIYYEIVNLFRMASWDNYDCHLLSCLLNNCPTDTIIPVFFEHLVKRISAMFPQKNVNSGAMKVLVAILKHVDLYTWNTVFVPSLMEVMPSDVLKERAYMKSTFLECVSLAVKKFGGELSYVKAREVNLPDSYLVLVIFCGVHQGSIDIYNKSEHEIDTDLLCMLQSESANVKYYAFKTLCIFNNKRSQLGPYELISVAQYLAVRNFVFDYDCITDLHYLLSHLCVKANNIIPNETPELRNYIAFVRFIYKGCMFMIQSKIPKQVAAGVQLFNMVRSIFEEDSHSLKLKYRLSKHDNYKAKEAPFYEFLEATNRWKFNKTETWDKLCFEFMGSEKVNIDMTVLMLRWCEQSLPKSQNDTAHIFFKGLTLLRMIYNHERVGKGCYCVLIGLYDCEVNGQLYLMLVKILSESLLTKNFRIYNFSDVVEVLNHSSVFGLTKTMGCLLQFKFNLIPDTFYDQAFEFCKDFIELMLFCINHDRRRNFYVSPNKVVEQMFIACLEVMCLLVDTFWDQYDGKYFKGAIQVANMIIETSNMKRPVTAAAVLLRQLCLKVVTSACEKLKVVVIKFLEYVLFSIYAAPNHLTSKIRRNPEHRLMIHAIVVADQRPNHPFLARAMEFLLGVLSDSSAMCSSVASALHSVEIILSENSLRLSTAPFISSVMVHCINTFSSKEWQIKNATMQVLKALTDRILGQKTNLLYRHHTIEDVFLLFPEVGVYFFAKLQDAQIESDHDSIIAILAVFSESHRKCSKFVCKDVEIVTDCFLRIFFEFISSDTTSVGVFAAKAYAALYPHLYIPFIICDVVDYLMIKFSGMKKNIFYTFLCLLQALYERFNVFSYVSYHKFGLSIIESSIQSLTLFLEKFNKLYELSLYSLLNITSNSIGNVENALTCHLQNRTYESRLWLNVNVPYLLNYINIKKFPDLLKICLDDMFSLSLKIHCLHTIANRCSELIECSFVDATLIVVLDSFLTLPFVNDYLLISYSSVFFILVQLCDITITENLLIKLRNQYKKVTKTNIYFVAVYVYLLYRVSSYTDCDRVFIKDAITVYKNATVVEDYELNLHVSLTLKFLYKCVETTDRYEVLKLAFILLLNEETSFEIRKFISEIFNVGFASTFESLKVLISYKHLIQQLCEEFRVFVYFMDLLILLSSLKDVFEYNGNFYYKKNSDICLHKHTLKQLLLDKVKYVFMAIPRNACLKLLCNVRYILID